MSDVIVVGGGVIGMGIAWRAAQAGREVTVIDPEPGRGATWAAAGLLAPVTEVHPGDDATLPLALESARLYPGVVAELEATTGLDVGFQSTGTLVVALDGGDKSFVDHLVAYQQRVGLEVEPLTAKATRAHESLLAPRIRGGALVAGDHSVNNRRLYEALGAAATRAGASLVEAWVTSIETRNGRAEGVRLSDGTRLEADAVVLAAGAWSATIGGTGTGAAPAVRPVKGQILRLRTATGEPFMARPVRAVAAGRSVYVVPRADGEVVIGATVEEKGWDTTVTAEAVHELLHDAMAVIPAVGDLELVEASAGVRPGTPDNVPIIGRTSVERLLVATGHYRNGILLMPITADLIVQELRALVP